MCMRLRGENGIMKKKFDGLQSRIDKQLQDCEKLTDHEQDLQKVITSHVCKRCTHHTTVTAASDRSIGLGGSVRIEEFGAGHFHS